MGRNQFKAKQDTSIAPKAVEALLSAFDSPSNDSFALVTQGIDRHRLRIFDPRSSTIKDDFSSNKEDKFTCLAWGTSKSDVDLSKTSKKKRKTSSNSQKVLALGLQNGSIAIYSPAHGRVIKTLSGSHTLPVNDFVFNKAGTVGYSVSEDHHIVEWDIEDGRELSKWKADSKSVSKLNLNHSETKLATAGHTINIWDLATKKISKKFTGHASTITRVLFGPHDDICVSIAENDRYVNVWDCSNQSEDSSNITALTMDTDIVHVDISPANNTVLALSDDGLVGIWQNASSPTSASAASSGPKSKRKIRSSTRQPDTTIKVVSSEDDSTTIPILLTAFMSGSDKDFVIIARGSTLKPSFETVRFIDSSEALIQDILLTRQSVSGYLVDKNSLAANNLKTTQKKYDESSVTVLGNTDFSISNPAMAQDEDDENVDENEQSIEQKLSVLAVDESAEGADDKDAQNRKQKKHQPPPASSLQQMLVQALHSNDTQLLEACLTHSNPEIIRNTVRRLPTAWVIPFLQQIVDKFQERPNRGKVLLEWIKAILLIHTAYLMTVPDLVGKLSNFYMALDARLGVFQKLLGLHGRLDLVMSQIDMRSHYAQEDTTNEPINVYVEEDDEDEDEDDMAGEEDEDMMEYDEDDSDEDEDEDDEDVDSLDSDEEYNNHEANCLTIALLLSSASMSFFQDIAKSIKGNFEELEFRAKDALNMDDEEIREKKYIADHHRFDSFAPIRDNVQVKYFVDGKDYLWAVSEAIESARDMIFIEDWWLSPELFLRRPPLKYPEYRLDKLLKKKADEGVKIYVVVYEEVELALTLDSEHTKTWLQGLSENIVVQRHPDHNVGGTFFWAHHEKYLIVDNRIAFLGGLDLCFGRWDTHTHRLADFHCNDPTLEVWPGQDYSNPRIADFKDVQHWDMQLIDKTVLARMPWHDISLGMLGGPVLDVVRHAYERWNFIKHQKSMDRDEVPFLEPPLGGFSQAQKFEIPHESRFHFRKHAHNTRGITGSCHTQILRSSADWSSNIETEHSIQNAYIESIRNAQRFIYIENQFFITSTKDDKDYTLKNQIGAAIVERIVRAHELNEKFRIIVVMPLIPAFPADLSSKDAGVARLVMHWQYVSISRGGRSIIEELQKAGIDASQYISFFALRSYDRINRSHVEQMLTQVAGYSASEVQAAGASQRPEERRAEFIQEGEPDFVRGTEASVRHQHPFQNFEDRMERIVDYTRVPEEGEGKKVLDEAVKTARHNYAKDSVGRDAMEGGDLANEPWVDDSTSSRPRGQAAETDESADYVTEELYIHAKTMIIDDRIVIMGSANLNDRSQMGNRDSEIAMIVEDTDIVPSKMNGEHWEAGRFAVTLRRQLWKEHLGLLEDQDVESITASMHPPPVAQDDTLRSKEDRLVQDPLDDETYHELWVATAKKNTDAFREVFHCVPDDSVHNWDDYKAFYPDPTKISSGHVADPSMTVEQIRAQLDPIRGHLVEFPLNFLDGVDLKGESLESLANDAVMELYT